MRITQLKDEDFVNYKKPSMFIGTCICDWKCCIEQSLDTSICQNHSLQNGKIIVIPYRQIYERYINNPISKSIVLGGLEPFKQFTEVYNLINYFRTNKCMDEFVIYTGYYPDEIKDNLNLLKQFKNIIIKFGRFIPNQNPHYDDCLGIKLASDNQYAERVS